MLPSATNTIHVDTIISKHLKTRAETAKGVPNDVKLGDGDCHKIVITQKMTKLPLLCRNATEPDWTRELPRGKFTLCKIGKQNLDLLIGPKSEVETVFHCWRILRTVVQHCLVFSTHSIHDFTFWFLSDNVHH